MSVAADLRAFLLADAPLGGLLGDRVYPILLPQRPAFPALTYQVITGDRPQAYSGPLGLSRPRIQFDCWAATYLEMEALAAALRNRVNGFSGIMGTAPGTAVQGIFFESERDLYEEGADQATGSGAGLYRRSVDYFFNYTDA